MLDDDLESDLAQRLRAGTGGIRPRADAMHVVRHHVQRRKRRRRTVAVVAATVAAVVVAGGSTLALTTLTDRGEGPPPASDGSTGAELPRDGRRPVAFFVELVGGRGAAKDNSFRPVPGERINAQFNWWPGDGTGDYPVFGGAAVERYGSRDAAATCASLADELGDAATCSTDDVGNSVLAYDGTVATAPVDPFHEQVRFGDGFGDPDPDDLVRRTTVLRPDGWAVSLSVCACSAIGPDLPEAPVEAAVLARAAADDDWIFRRGEQPDP